MIRNNNLNWLRMHILLSVLFLNISCSNASNFRVVGYVPNWIDVAAFANNFDYSKVTHINYCFQNPDANGNLVESNTGLTTLVSKAHANNVKVMISIGGGAAANDPVKTYFQNQITTAEKRGAFIHKIMSYVNQYKLDGVDVDEEGPAINSNYGAFIKQLSDSLKTADKNLSAAVGWGGDAIPNSCLPYFDWICIMAYDLTGSWDPSNPGQHSPYSYAVSTINDWTNRGVKKEQLVLGVPFYGYDFSVPEYIGYSSIIARYPNAADIDQVDQIWYNGRITMWKKTKLALQKISGVMIWELSLDASGDNSLLSVIDKTIDSAATSGYAEQKPVHELVLFPNPAQSEITIKGLPPLVDGGKIEVTDLAGRVLLSKDIALADSSLVLNISALKPGTYICILQVNQLQYTGILQKE